MGVEASAACEPRSSAGWRCCYLRCAEGSRGGGGCDLDCHGMEDVGGSWRRTVARSTFIKLAYTSERRRFCSREGLANGPGLTTRAYVIPTRVQPHAEPVRTSGCRCWQDSQHAPKSRHGNKLAVNLVVFTSLRTRVIRKSAVRAACSVLESLCTCIPPHTSPCRVSPATHFQTRTYSSDTIAPVSGDGVEQVRPDPAYSKPRAPVKQMCLFSYCSLDSSKRYFPSKNTDLTKLHKLPNKSNLRGIRSGKDRDMSHTNVSEPKLTVCVAS
jgi:hypothetical protein